MVLKKSTPSSAILVAVASQLPLPERQIALYLEQNGHFQTLECYATVGSLGNDYYSSKNLVVFIVGAEARRHV